MDFEQQKQNIKVSIVIPVYNAEEFIIYTLDSILNQSSKPTEIIVIDDCSFDNTYTIVKEYFNNKSMDIRLIKNNINRGISYCRNMGLKIAKEEYVLFMDHDDIAEERLLEKEIDALKHMQKSYKCNWSLVYSAYSQIDELGNSAEGIFRSKQVKPHETLGYEFVRNEILTVSGVLLNKNLVLNIGGFDETIKYSQDWDLWIRLADLGGFVYVNEPLIRVRRFNKNTSRNINNFLNDERKILRKYTLDRIKEALFSRELQLEKNKLDYISILVRLDLWDEANKNINELIKNTPDFLSAYFFKGLYYIKNKELIKAKYNFNKVIEINHKHGAALNNLGALLILDNKDLSKAEEVLRKALEIYPNYNDANHNMNLLKSKKINIQDVKFTWRELRTVLLNYIS